MELGMACAFERSVASVAKEASAFIRNTVLLHKSSDCLTYKFGMLLFKAIA
jgi:hypothetical protein